MAIITANLDQIDRGPQARKHFDQAALDLLAANIREYGLLNPLTVKKNGDRYTLVAGERRFLAMKQAGITSCQANVLPDMDAGGTQVIQWIENFHRANLKPSERVQALSDIKQQKGWNNKQVAEHLHIDPSLVGRYLSLRETVPTVQQAAAEGKLTINQWYAISRKKNPEEQQEILNMYLAGLPESQITAITSEKKNGTVPSQRNGTVSPKRNGTVPQTRHEKITLPAPPTGLTIVFTGEKIVLEDMIEATKEILDKMKKASKDKHDAKSFERVCQEEADDGRIAG